MQPTDTPPADLPQHLAHADDAHRDELPNETLSQHQAHSQRQAPRPKKREV